MLNPNYKYFIISLNFKLKNSNILLYKLTVCIKIITFALESIHFNKRDNKNNNNKPLEDQLDRYHFVL
jgi:hypothetical protein